MADFHHGLLCGYRANNAQQGHAADNFMDVHLISWILNVRPPIVSAAIFFVPVITPHAIMPIGRKIFLRISITKARFLKEYSLLHAKSELNPVLSEKKQMHRRQNGHKTGKGSISTENTGRISRTPVE